VSLGDGWANAGAAAQRNNRAPMSAMSATTPWWEPYADECDAAAAVDGASFVLSFEAEAVYDAQAFSRDYRCLKLRLANGVVALAATLAYDGETTAEESFERDVSPTLEPGACCFLLFRIRTWALFTWAPATAADADAYLAARDELRVALGGSVRVPHAFAWRARSDAVLHECILSAGPLGYGDIPTLSGRTRHNADEHPETPRPVVGRRDGDEPETSNEPRSPPPETARPAATEYGPGPVRYAL